MLKYRYNNASDITAKDVKKFMKKAYKFLNGKINPVIRCESLNFIESHGARFIYDKDEDVHYTIGVAHLNKITINLDYIMDVIDQVFPHKGYVVDSINGYLLMIIAHELSHLDQVEDNKTDLQSRINHEWSNERHARNYIKAMEQEICHELGDLNFETSNLINSYSDYEEKATDDTYYSIKSIYERFEDILELFHLDIKKIIQDGKYELITFFVDNSVRKMKSAFDLPLNYIYYGHTDESYDIIHNFLKYIANDVFIFYKWDITIHIENDNNIVLYFEPVGGTANSLTLSFSMAWSNETEKKLEGLIIKDSD